MKAADWADDDVVVAVAFVAVVGIALPSVAAPFPRFTEVIGAATISTDKRLTGRLLLVLLFVLVLLLLVASVRSTSSVDDTLSAPCAVVVFATASDSPS